MQKIPNSTGCTHLAGGRQDIHIFEKHGTSLNSDLVWRQKAQLLREQGLYSSRRILSVDHEVG